MNLVRLLLLLILLMLPAIADAGAWSREKGSLFIASSTTLSYATDGTLAHDASLYIEYGLTQRLTLGFDGYLAATGGTSNGVAFLRFPIGNTERPTRTALTFGIGADITLGGTATPVLKLGASIGRGLAKGWLNIDSFVTFNKTSTPPDLKADFTWGMKPNDRTLFIWQLQTGKPSLGTAYANFAPSVVWSFGKRRRNQLEVGVIMGLTGAKTNSVKIGLWKSF